MTEYTPDLQKFFLEMMLHDPNAFVRVQSIFNYENFDRSLRQSAKFIKNHSEQYSSLPTHEQIKAVTGTTLSPLPNLDESHYDWFLTEFESFTKRKEMERAILKAADLIAKNEFEPVEKLIKDAIQIGLVRDMGTNYFESPASRIQKYFSSGGQTSTGWTEIDELLYGGMSRGELNIFAGGSGSGKSLLMMNLALNWLKQGLHGVYISLELSEELCGLRTDAMLASVGTRQIKADISNTEVAIKEFEKKYGSYQIKRLPAQSSVNDIKAYLREFQIQTGRKPDFVMVDYIDIVMPSTVKVDPSDLFVKDKYVCEELRNMAIELGILLVSASQLGRGAVEETEFNHSHIAGGISKINTCDNIFAIFTSRALRERGGYQLQCLKSRSSTGEGHKIDLSYNMETMRITDGEKLDQIDNDSEFNSLSSIATSFKKQTETVETPKQNAKSDMLKSLLSEIKSKNKTE